MCFTSNYKGSPADIIPHGNIKFEAGKLIVEGIKEPVWIVPVRSASMEGVMKVGHSVVLSGNQECLDEAGLGDIVVFQRGTEEVTINGNPVEVPHYIMHQIVKVGNDGEWWCTTKGSSNFRADPEKHRRQDIKWRYIGQIC